MKRIVRHWLPLFFLGILGTATADAGSTSYGVRQAHLYVLWLGVFWCPFAIAAAFAGVSRIRWHLRAPDVVITVTERLKPLELTFQEQDRRLERRERLKGELFKLNGEIETFNAEMDFDTRHAWANRPGPYGK